MADDRWNEDQEQVTDDKVVGKATGEDEEFEDTEESDEDDMDDADEANEE